MGPPLGFLLFKRSLQNRMSVKGLPFQFFWHCAIFSLIFFVSNGSLRFYLSLRYGADLCVCFDCLVVLSGANGPRHARTNELSMADPTDRLVVSLIIF